MKIQRNSASIKAKGALVVLSMAGFSHVAFAQQGLGFASDVIEPVIIDVQQSEVLIDIDGRSVLTTVINGTDKTIDSSNGLDSYLVLNGGRLNVVNGGSVDAVELRRSALHVLSGTVVNGINNIDGEVFLDQATVHNSFGMGLRLASDTSTVGAGPTAYIRNSSISGLGIGLATGVQGELWLAHSDVSVSSSKDNPGVALRMDGGIAHVSEGSRITGLINGIAVVDGSRGPDGTLFNSINRFEIDDSLVSSVEGAAIKIIGSRYQGGVTTADITVQNGSELRPGNGRLLEVENKSEVKFKVDNSTLGGDLWADEGAFLDVTLTNNASLVGNIINGNSLTNGPGSLWQLSASSVLKSLIMNSGRISFAGDGFHTLSLGELAGNGTFDMRINLDTAKGDLLEVNGQATGHHLLNVKNTGVEAVPAEFDPLRIVHTEGGDAQFGLIGNRVDLGAYSYLLEKQGNDWFIVGEGKTISPSTQSALALFNAAPNIWNSELTTLRSRMGEVRGQEEGGGWIRSYGNRFDASTGSGLSYQQNQQGMSFGADAPMPVGKGSLVVGLMGGYSKSDLDLSRGSSGTVNSYYIGTYGTWLSDDGYYLDGVLKFNRFRNESKVAMSDGSKAKGRYSNAGVGGSVEFGKHIKLADGYFIEPYTQLSGVSIGGDSYSLDNGMTARNSRTQSVLGKVGTTAGRNFALEDGSVVQPYVRVAMAHEFARSNDVTVNDTRFNNDLLGSRAELGAGVAVTLSKRIQLHADFDYMKGKHVEQPWGANLGLKLAF